MKAPEKSIFSFAALLLLCLDSTQNSAQASDALQGRIQQNLHNRVQRPARPSRPSGEALEHVSGGVKRKAQFKITASSVSQMLDKDSFSLANPEGDAIAGGITKEKTDEKKQAKSNPDQEKDMVIAWDNWHKRVTEAIFRNWEVYGNIPGAADVVLDISKDGQISFRMRNFEVSPLEQISSDQERLFERSLERTLKMVEHSDLLEFPSGSKRERVEWSTSFILSGDLQGPSGYSWKKNDYEHVQSPGSR